jgi:hypothetical protein
MTNPPFLTNDEYVGLAGWEIGVWYYALDHKHKHKRVQVFRITLPADTFAIAHRRVDGGSRERPFRAVARHAAHGGARWKASVLRRRDRPGNRDTDSSCHSRHTGYAINVVKGYPRGTKAPLKRSQPWVGLGLIDLQHLAMARPVYPPVFFLVGGLPQVGGERRRPRACGLAYKGAVPCEGTCARSMI